jgi:hypothetical protein
MENFRMAYSKYCLEMKYIAELLRVSTCHLNAYFLRYLHPSCSWTL